MMSKRFYGAALMAAIVIPVTLEGCSSDNPLCCSEFKAGATLNADIGGSAQAQVAVQAVADFSGIASAALDDLTTACRGIAQDLAAPQADQDAAEATADKQGKMNKWCAVAVSAIGSVKASLGGSVQLKIVATPPVCQASISAKANCQAKCTGSASCDLKANPPSCSGGPDKLQISCSGSCTAQASASLTCEGSCDATCEGSCTADATIGVDCKGKCDGKCEAKAGVGTGEGSAADGTCQGTCKGTCAVTAPNVKCSGTCKGGCKGTCSAKAGGSVTCNGTCSAPDFKPIKCEGGEITGGCKADVKCDGNCDASVSAKAECSPPEVTVTFSGAADLEAAGKLVATLKAHLGVVLAFKSRLEGMGALTATIGGNADAVVSIKAACIPQVVAAAAQAVGDVTAAGQATASVAGSVTTGG